MIASFGSYMSLSRSISAAVDKLLNMILKLYYLSPRTNKFNLVDRKW